MNSIPKIEMTIIPGPTPTRKVLTSRFSLGDTIYYVVPPTRWYTRVRWWITAKIRRFFGILEKEIKC